MPYYEGQDSQGNRITITERQTTGEAAVALAGAMGGLFDKMGLRSKLGRFIALGVFIENVIIIGLALGLVNRGDWSAGLINGFIALMVAVIPLSLNRKEGFRKIAQYAYPALWLLLGILTKDFLGTDLFRIIPLLGFGALSYFAHIRLGTEIARNAKNDKAAAEAKVARKHINPELPFSSDFRATAPVWKAYDRAGVDDYYDSTGYHVSFDKWADIDCPWTAQFDLKGPYSIDVQAGIEEMPFPGAIKVYFNDVGDHNQTSFLLLNNRSVMITRSENGNQVLKHEIENAVENVADVHITLRQFEDHLEILIDGKTIANDLPVPLPHENIGISIGGLVNTEKGQKLLSKVKFTDFKLNRL